MRAVAYPRTATIMLRRNCTCLESLKMPHRLLTWPALILCAANLMIMVGGMLIAIWIRLRIAIGSPLGAEYQAQPWSLYALLTLSTLAAYAVALSIPSHTRLGHWLAPWRQFRILLLALFMATSTILLLLPDISQLQMIYFVPATLLIGVAVVVVPGRLRASAYIESSTPQNLREIYQNRQLLLLWLRYRIEARYSQTLLGILWIVLLPLSMSFVMTFAFTQLLGRAQGIGVPFVVFLLSGQIMFGVFNHVVSNSKNEILSMVGLVKQVYFPREILIMLVLGEALVDFFFTFLVLLGINLLMGVPPTLYLLLLPLPLLLMTILSLGVGFIVSWLSMIVRDMQPLIAVILQLLFYVTVLFSAQSVDPRYEFLMSINPVSAIVEAFRDITIYGRAPDPVRLYLPIVLSVVLLYMGYVFFKVNEDRFVDYA